MIMWKDAYLESRVLAADPVELVRMVYQYAVDSVRDARHQLTNGSISARSQAIGRAVAALDELDCSLDHTVGGTISRNLAELYFYIRQLLNQANQRQEDGPLAEAESLLTTLSEAWKATSTTAVATEFEVSAGFHPTPSAVWQESAYAAAHSWNG